MNELEPIRVQLSDVSVWLRESIALMRRKFWILLPLSLLVFYLANKLQMFAYVTFFAGLLLCQACLAISIEIASAADNSRAVSVTRCYRALTNSVAAAVVLALFYVLLWLAAAKLSTVLIDDSVFAGSDGPPAIASLQWLYQGTIALFVVYIGVMISTLWFLLPLIVFHKLPLLDAMRLAKRGEQKNFLVVVVASYAPFSLFFVLFMFSELALIVAVAGLPLFGIYLYVSYRHVYLGRRDNAPVPVQNSVTDSVAAG